MSGKLLAGFLVITALIAGAAMYWLQVYAYYDEVALAEDGGAVEMRLTRAGGDEMPLATEEFQAIDSASSPIRFRACFIAAPSDFADAVPATDAVPLTAPGWFDCFDAGAIGAALQAGEAAAYLGQSNALYGIDRVIALYPDGRAFAWQQINRCGAEVFDGNPPPPGCPPVPQGTK